MTAHESSRSSNCSAAVGSWLRTGTTVSTDQDPMSSVTGNGPSSCAADMDGGRILFDVAARISDTARKRITKGAGTGGDVLLSHKGTVGKLALAPLNAPPFVCSPQTTFWRTLNEEEIDRRYLYYYMCSADFRAQLDARKGETDMADYVSLTAQRELRITGVPYVRWPFRTVSLACASGRCEQRSCSPPDRVSLRTLPSPPGSDRVG